MPRLLLIDFAGMAARCHFAPAREAMRPDEVGDMPGVSLFLRRIRDMLRTVNPRWVCAAMDAPRDSLKRRQWFPGYKSHRAAHDPEYVDTLKAIRTILRVCGFPLVSLSEWEADDVIATLCAEFTAGGADVVIASNDKDMHQLLRDGQVHQMDTMTFDVTTERDAVKRWGSHPSMIPTIQAMMGDSQDGVPGIAGIGEKKAKMLVADHGDWSSIVAAAAMNNLSPKMGEAIIKADADGTFALMHKLVALNDELPLDTDLESLEFGTLNLNKARPLLLELGIRRW